MRAIESDELSWREWQAVVDGLLRDHSSHTCAAVAGWAYVPTPAEVAFYDELDVKIQMNRGKNQPSQPPVQRPWMAEKPKLILPKNDPATMSRRARLNAHLGLTSE